jgi:hypothetical protein
MPCLRLTITVLLLLSLAARGQERPGKGQVEVWAVGGISHFYGDNSFPDHWFAGGGPRYFIAKGIAIEPEVLHQSLAAMGVSQDFVRTSVISQFIYEFKGNIYKSCYRPRPYLIAGIGYSSLRERTGAAITETPMIVGQGGVGLKIYLGKKTYVAPEIRAGYRPLFQAGVGIGFILR